ncbi:MAG: CBS domain-containing protein [Luteitalea sp.]|nr:CBS domain-containing protein [Luteitalea sp.]
MSWSIRIATVAGIPVYLHITFVAFIGFILLSGWRTDEGLTASIGRVVFVLAIFGTVVLHEFGHALTARRFGIRTRDITLLPIGGLARLERMPEEPRQELWVALAGPAVNAALAIATFLAILLIAADVPLSQVLLERPEGIQGVARDFLLINVALALFNLIPAFPMDGGRALRALLATRFDYVRATEIAAALGQGLAMLFGFWGLFTNPMLVFIALFVWLGASAESSMVSLRSALAGVPVYRAMITEFHTLHAEDPLQRAADLVISGTQQNFPVIEDGQLIGVLTRDGLVKAVTEQGLTAPVREAMSTTFGVVDPREMLDRALARLQEAGSPVLPVLDGRRLVGLLTSENIGEFVMLRKASS